MAFKGMSITYQGRNLLNQSQANKAFKIKCIRIGDGQYTGDLHEIQNLINPLYDVKAEVHHEGNNLFIDADINSNDHSGYYLREIGLIALDSEGREVVYAYDNAGDDAEFISPSDSNVAYENRLRFCFTITDDINVSIELNGNVYALQKDFTNLSNKVKNMEDVGVQVADPFPIGAQTVFVGEKEDIPSNWEIVEGSAKQLLINNDFQCNQRVSKNYISSNNQYTVDMWVGRSLSDIEVVENGISLKRNGSNYGTLVQYLEDDWQNKCATLVVKVNETVLSLTISNIESTVDAEKWLIENVVGFGFLKIGDRYAIALYNHSTIPAIFEYADLFEGDVAYPHIKEDYAVALLKCQKYLIVLKHTDGGSSGRYIGIVKKVNATSGLYMIPIPTMMKKLPTIKPVGLDIQSLASITFDTMNMNGNTVSGTCTTSNGPLDTVYMIQIKSATAYLELSCEPL